MLFLLFTLLFSTVSQANEENHVYVENLTFEEAQYECQRPGYRFAEPEEILAFTRDESIVSHFRENTLYYFYIDNKNYPNSYGPFKKEENRIINPPEVDDDLDGIFAVLCLRLMDSVEPTHTNSNVDTVSNVTHPPEAALQEHPAPGNPQNCRTLETSDLPSAQGLPRLDENSPTDLIWISENQFDLSSAQSGNLIRNEQTHAEERSFACRLEGCNKSFTTDRSRKRHEKNHTGERHFACRFEGCNKSFIEAGNRKVHERSHTGERHYACRFGGCDESFTYAKNRKKHEQEAHTRKKLPYTWQFEDKSFNAK